MTGLVISEVFGPTFQGEGPHIGQRVGFVRFGLCNLTCHWCDAAYTWDWTRYDRAAELERRSVDSVVEQVGEMGVGRVVVTGGEPTVQRSGLADLAAAFVAAGIAVEVETNGTLAPSGLAAGSVDHWNVSPKLDHARAGNRAKCVVPDVLHGFLGLPGTVAFKFVATGPGDLDEIAEVVAEADLPDRYVWVMPEGVTAAVVHERMSALSPQVLDRGWNLSGRMHIDLWGDKRGH